MDYHEIGSFDDWWHVDPFVLEYVTSEGLDLDYVRVEFKALVPPSVIKDKPYANNGGFMSDYCRFAEVAVHSCY